MQFDQVESFDKWDAQGWQMSAHGDFYRPLGAVSIGVKCKRRKWHWWVFVNKDDGTTAYTEGDPQPTPKEAKFALYLHYVEGEPQPCRHQERDDRLQKEKELVDIINQLEAELVGRRAELAALQRLNKRDVAVRNNLTARFRVVSGTEDSDI